MTEQFGRRGFLGGALALGATLSAPARAFATVSTLTPYQRRVAAAAVRQQVRLASVVTHHDIVGVADFALASSEPRMHLVDILGGTVRSHLVAHGRGSDPEHDGWLKSFSNIVGSEATSRGAYVTMADYMGKYGASIRLVGVDHDNSNALDRAIVMHPAWYAAPDMVAKWGKLGRSEGCFAIDPAQFGNVLRVLAGGRLLFADRIGIAA